MGCKLFFSDCHISAGLGLIPDGANAHPWEWLSQKDQERLDGFITWVGKRTDVDEVILLGDIFDNWIFPHDLKPPTLREILGSTNAKPLVQALDRLSKKIKTTFLPGNHDLTISASVLSEYLPGVGFAGPGLQNPHFSWGRLRAEHGHSYGLFNAPDPMRKDGLPLGYFISRMVATADRKTGNHTPSLVDEIGELAELATSKEALAQAVFDAICSKAGVSQDAEILMPDDLWGGGRTTAAEVRGIYRNLYQEWKARNGSVSAVIAIPAELNDLSIVADDIFLHGDVRAVVMGHSHQVATKQHSVPILGSRVYANSGTWCHNTPHASWVEATDSSHSLRLTVYGCTGFDSSGTPHGLAPLLPPVST